MLCRPTALLTGGLRTDERLLLVGARVSALRGPGPSAALERVKANTTQKAARHGKERRQTQNTESAQLYRTRAATRFFKLLVLPHTNRRLFSAPPGAPHRCSAKHFRRRTDAAAAASVPDGACSGAAGGAAGGICLKRIGSNCSCGCCCYENARRYSELSSLCTWSRCCSCARRSSKSVTACGLCFCLYKADSGPLWSAGGNGCKGRGASSMQSKSQHSSHQPLRIGSYPTGEDALRSDGVGRSAPRVYVGPLFVCSQLQQQLLLQQPQ